MSTIMSSRPLALSSSPLQEFPFEIFLCIVDHLPREAALSFFLSCWNLKHRLGTDRFSNLTTSVSNSKEHNIAFLELLAIDFPNAIVCVPCRRLHGMENIQRYDGLNANHDNYDMDGNLLPKPACVAQDSFDDTHLVSRLFGTAAFKMAIKRHQLRPDSMQIISKMSRTTPPIVEDDGYMLQRVEECRIVNGHLMHRLQSVHLLGFSTGDVPDEEHRRVRSWQTSIQGDRIVTKELPGFLKRCRPDGIEADIICPHIDLDVAQAMRRYEHPEIKRCNKCRTEFIINDGDYYNRKGVFLTRWKDLGPSPESEIWKEHISKHNRMDILEKYVLLYKIHEVDSARKRFPAFHANLRQPELIPELGQSSTSLGSGTQSEEHLEKLDGKRPIPSTEISSAFGDGEDFRFDEWLNTEAELDFPHGQTQDSMEVGSKASIVLPEDLPFFKGYTKSRRKR